MYSVMWSEHCSYKSSKVHLAQFSEIPQVTRAGKMLAGIGENAGVIDIGQGYAVTFKVESHNHPSYVEPYQGAATGVGGIVRDILAMGARPVAVMDPLRFGPLDAAGHPSGAAGDRRRGRRLRQLPRPAQHRWRGRLRPDLPRQPARQRALRRRPAPRGPAPREGERRRQPRDPVRREDRRRRHRRGQRARLRDVRVDRPGQATQRPGGRPVQEKLLIECTLELFAAGIVAGIQDLGGAGLSCATSELASAGDGGMHVELDLVPLRDSSLAPEEILMSESQERMMAVVEPADVDAFLAICEKWDVDATVDRRGHRRRPAADRLARGERRRRAAPLGRARRSDLPPPVRAARRAGRSSRPTRAEALARPTAPATSSGRRCCGWSPAPTSATSPGSPTSTTATSRATPSSRSRATAG